MPQLAVASVAKLAAQGLLADGQIELAPDPLHQVDKPPAHHAVRGRDRPSLDDADKRTTLPIAQQRFRVWRIAIDKNIGTRARLTALPVPNDLKADAAKASRFAPAMAVLDRDVARLRGPPAMEQRLTRAVPLRTRFTTQTSQPTYFF